MIGARGHHRNRQSWHKRETRHERGAWLGRAASWLTDSCWWLTSAWRLPDWLPSLVKWLVNELEVIVTVSVFISMAAAFGKVLAAGPKLGFHGNTIKKSTAEDLSLLTLNSIKQAIGSKLQRMTSFTALKLYQCVTSDRVMTLSYI